MSGRTKEEARAYNKAYREKNAKRIAAQRKAYRANNKDKIAQQRRDYLKRNSEKLRQTQRLKYIKNKDKYSEQAKKYYKENSETIKERTRAYYYANRDAILAKEKEKIKTPKQVEAARKSAARYARERRKSDALFTITGRMRCRINDALRKRGFPKTGKTEELLGCSYETLLHHLESQFRDGMSWGNRNHWHIDHITPLASARTEEELTKLFHYTNLQPLWARDNLKKGAKANHER